MILIIKGDDKLLDRIIYTKTKAEVFILKVADINGGRDYDR